MDENDKIFIDDLQRTYERAYTRGFYDGIQFLLDIAKDDMQREGTDERSRR